jgi:hypothetical protein
LNLVGPVFERPALALDGEWRFIPDFERSLDPSRLPDGDPIVVPGCWEAQVGWRPIVTAWYTCRFAIPADWSSGRVVLCFGAVMYHAAVYLNGSPVGEHEGGYTPFELDLTAPVRWAADNALAVRVTNPMNALTRFPVGPGDLDHADKVTPDWPASEIPHGKQTWYSSQSGIWQSVRLERRSETALERLRIVPDVAGSATVVHWSLDDGGPKGSRADHSRLELRVSIDDPDGQTVADETFALDGARGDVRLAIRDVRLWGIGRPNLYRARASLLAGDRAIDGVETRFGMREFRTEAGRFLLNGEPVYLLGALDQDLYPETISTPPSRAMLDAQIARACELGLNLLRCHIKVPDPAYLEAADEAGVLVWCELPNWARFSAEAARRGRDTLQAMVETLGNHPSIVIWTIVNEDWGTRLREERGDRLWLAEMYAWLKKLDPTRLVVDNSACDTASTPNFHVASDIADFHVYHAAPDNASRWRHRMSEFAARPAWLWSPHGDARPSGDEPLVLSEFGTWALPRPDRLVGGDGTAPWWFETGRGNLVPSGIAGRFVSQRLDRVWPSVDALAEATQRHAFEALQYEIGEIRRHDPIQGYVVTELADAYWEANGLLDVHRGPKVFHEAFAQVNAPDVVVADLSRRDIWAGDSLEATIHLSSFGPPSERGHVDWRLVARETVLAKGRLAVSTWPTAGAREVAKLAFDIPSTAGGDAALRLEAFDDKGRRRAVNEYRLAILSPDPRTADRLRIRVEDPLAVWRVDERLAALGHEVVDDGADLMLGTTLSPEMLAAVEAGSRALVLVRDRGALGRDQSLARPVDVRARSLPDPDSPDGRSPWHGDWVTAWSWLLPGALRGVPNSNPLDFAYAEVMPDHVLAGYEPSYHADEVMAGMFAGWVHAPAAVIWTFPQGAGRLTLTTFRLAPEDGPVATIMLGSLVERAADIQSDGKASARPPEAESIPAG